MTQAATPTPAPARRVQVQKQRRRREQPALDLRTPAGRALPY